MMQDAPFVFTRDSLREIRRLAATGKTASQIVSMLRMQSPGVLASICAKHGIDVAPEYQELPRIKVALSGLIPVAIRRAAVSRGTTAEMMTARIMEIIARDDMFSAILDD